MDIVERMNFKKLTEVTQTGQSSTKPYLNPAEEGLDVYSPEVEVLLLLVDGTGNLDLGGKQLYDYTEKVLTTSQAAAYAIDFRAGGVVELTLTGSVAITFSNIPATHSATVVLHVVQDGVGSHTLSWPATVRWDGGVAPTLTGTASSEDVITLWTKGGVVYGVTTGAAFAVV